MAFPIVPAARDAGVVGDPVIGLLIMGRKRPGFDMEWGAATRASLINAVEALPWKSVVPSQSIADEAALRAAVETCRDAGVTVPVVVQPTISDGRLAPLLSRLWPGPLLLWATPEKPTGRMISANSLVGTHVMAANLRQIGHPLEIVYGSPGDAETALAVLRSIRAIHAADSVTGRIFGLVGGHAPGFVDFHADPVFIDAALGSTLFTTGSVELIQRVRALDGADLSTERAGFDALGLSWSSDADGAPGSDGAANGPSDAAVAWRERAMEMQARYYRAFRDLFEENRLDALAFRCWPDLPSELGHWPYLALARLVSEGFPIAMEGDIDGAICGRIAESAGIGPVYLSDWLHHDRDSITIWHTGAAPFQHSIEAGAGGGPGAHLSVQFNNRLPTVVQATIRPMEATLFRIWRFEGEYHMTAMEGRTVAPERDLMATNGLFSVDGIDVRDWFEEQVQRGMPHHVCVVEGHHADLLVRVGRLLGMIAR